MHVRTVVFVLIIALCVPHFPQSRKIAQIQIAQRTSRFFIGVTSHETHLTASQPIWTAEASSRGHHLCSHSSPTNGRQITIKMRLFPPRFAASVHKMLDFYSQFNPSPLSIKQFIDFGKSQQKESFFNCHHNLRTAFFPVAFISSDFLNWKMGNKKKISLISISIADCEVHFKEMPHQAHMEEEETKATEIMQVNENHLDEPHTLERTKTLLINCIVYLRRTTIGTFKIALKFLFIFELGQLSTLIVADDVSRIIGCGGKTEAGKKWIKKNSRFGAHSLQISHN